jgi:hypothetical protein
VIADPSNLYKGLGLLSNDPVIDVVVLSLNAAFYSATLYGDGTSRLYELIQGLKAFIHDFPDGKPVVAAISDQGYPSEAEMCIGKLIKAGIPAFPSLARACRALRRLAGYHGFLKRKQENYC